MEGGFRGGVYGAMGDRSAHSETIIGGGKVKEQAATKLYGCQTLSLKYFEKDNDVPLEAIRQTPFDADTGLFVKFSSKCTEALHVQTRYFRF